MRISLQVITSDFQLLKSATLNVRCTMADAGKQSSGLRPMVNSDLMSRILFSSHRVLQAASSSNLFVNFARVSEADGSGCVSQRSMQLSENGKRHIFNPYL